MGGWAPNTSSAGMFMSSMNMINFLPSGEPNMPLHTYIISGSNSVRKMSCLRWDSIYKLRQGRARQIAIRNTINRFEKNELPQVGLKLDTLPSELSRQLAQHPGPNSIYKLRQGRARQIAIRNTINRFEKNELPQVGLKLDTLPSELSRQLAQHPGPNHIYKLRQGKQDSYLYQRVGRLSM